MSTLLLQRASRGDALPPPALFTYGALGMPLAMAALPLYVHLPQFYGAGLGVDLAVLGAILLALRALDAIVDPWIGVASDRLGRRRTLLAIGALVLAAGFVALFTPPAGSTGFHLAWLVATLAIVYLAYSVATINHAAWGAELSRDPEERTRITATREALALVGVVAASVVPAFLAAPGDASGLSRFALVFAAVTLATLVLSAWAPAPPRVRAGTGMRLADAVAPLRDPAFRPLVTAFLLNGIASAIPATLVLFFIADVIVAPQAQGWLLAAYFVAGAAGMPLWVALASRIGKLEAWAAGIVLAVVAFGGTIALGEGDVVPFALICVASGLALGADLALPPSVLADVIDRPGARGGAGAYFGVWTLVTKLSLALAAGVALPLVSAAGYTPGTKDPEALRSLAFVYALVPCALKLVAFAIVTTLAHRRRLA